MLQIGLQANPYSLMLMFKFAGFYELKNNIQKVKSGHESVISFLLKQSKILQLIQDHKSDIIRKRRYRWCFIK